MNVTCAYCNISFNRGEAEEHDCADFACSDDAAVNQLGIMWNDQEKFMRILQEKRNFPDFPADLSSKDGQKFIKKIMYECADEMHEARQHLKQKDHRATEVTSVDRKEYIEELVDSLKFFFEVCIVSGISRDELFNAYMEKSRKNIRRINEGY